MSQLRLEGGTVNSKGEYVKFVYPCDISEVLPWSTEAMLELKKKSLGTLTDGEKRFMVKQVWGNALGSSASTMQGKMLNDADLCAIFEILQYQYQQPLVTMVKAAAVKLAMCEGVSTSEGQLCILEIKYTMERCNYAVLPIHCEDPLHWTVLVLHMEALGSDKVKEAFYFDWCRPCMPGNRNYARKVLRLVTIADTSFMELPDVHNRYEQRAWSNDCGFAFWYALEVFMKKERLEGDWTLYPRPEKWRTQLHDFKKSLVKEQQKWLLQDAEKKKDSWRPKFLIHKPGEKVLDKQAEKAEIEKQMKSGSCRHKATDFFACGSCRWTTSGEGCFNCNPAKAAEVKATREKQAQQLKKAVEVFYEILQKQGILPAHVPEDKPCEASTDLMAGGGST